MSVGGSLLISLQLSVTEKESGRKFEVAQLPNVTVGLWLQTESSRFRERRAPQRPQNALLSHQVKLLHVAVCTAPASPSPLC